MSSEPAPDSAEGEPRVFVLTLEYDGRGFEGWQRQPDGARTVQGCLESALAELVGEPVAVVGAGRTDAGVHAEGQVASAALATRLDAATLRRALNARLPRDLAVVEAHVGPEDFHARRWARSKLYRYRIWNGPDRSPRREGSWLHVPRTLDLASMARAAGDLEGHHDFTTFRAAGSSVKTSDRTLHRVVIRGEKGGEIELEFAGSGFLRHMVRNLVGTLVEVGLGRRDPTSMPSLLAARDRSLAGPTAAACGLCLVSVALGRPESRSSV